MNFRLNGKPEVHGASATLLSRNIQLPGNTLLPRP
jgi:hypothetical protein